MLIRTTLCYTAVTLSFLVGAAVAVPAAIAPQSPGNTDPTGGAVSPGDADSTAAAKPGGLTGVAASGPRWAPDDTDSVPLTLDEVLRRTLESNLDIRVSQLDPKQQEQNEIIARAVFDPSAYASFRRNKEDFVQTNKVTSATSSQFDQYLAGVRQAFPWGGGADLQLTSSRSDVVAPFQVFNPTYGAGFALSFTQPLLRGVGTDVNRLNIEIARLVLTGSEAEFRRGVMNKIRQASDAYWNLRAARYALLVAHDSLDLANDLLRLNRAKVEVGTLAPIEITQAEAGVASREEAVINAEEAIEQAEDALRRFMNVEKGSAIWVRPLNPVDTPREDAVDLDLDEEVATALEKRPEIEARVVQVKSLELQAGADRNGILPQLDFEGSYGYSGTSGDQRFTKLDSDGDGHPDCDMSNPNCIGVPVDSNGDGINDAVFVPQDLGDAWQQVNDRDLPAWSAGLVFSIPFGNRAARARATRSRIGFEQGQLEIENLRRGIEIEVRDAVRSVRANLKRVQAARVNLDLQQQKVDAEQKRYQYGLSTSFQVLTFQTDLSDAQYSLIRSILDYNKSLTALEQATGVILENRGIEVQS